MWRENELPKRKMKCVVEKYEVGLMGNRSVMKEAFCERLQKFKEKKMQGLNLW